MFDSNSELKIGDHFLKADKWLNVLHLQTLSQIDLANPKVILEGVLHRRIVLLSEIKEYWSNFFGSNSIKP
jgi:hypothetical protein